MHVVHFPDAAKQAKEPNTIAGVVGIIFDTKAGQALTPAQESIIDTFFETLLWSDVTTNPTVNLVSYGNLMAMLDYENRRTYRGSLTTPPCTIGVYWNVLSTVLPVKQKYVDQFKA